MSSLYGYVIASITAQQGITCWAVIRGSPGMGII